MARGLTLKLPILTVTIGIFGVIALSAPTSAQQPKPRAAKQSVDPHAHETKAQHDARMQWWREARFGLFIHWGLYSVPAGTYAGKKIDGYGEWIMHTAHIPVATYAAYANQFDPEQFNAAQWVADAKAAGMKYIVMTAKHHEGFAMYPTKVDDFNIDAHTRFRRDPIGEMAAACKKAGLKFGVYYSQNLDWHHPGGGTAGPAWDPAQNGDFAQYVKNVSAPQVKELITRYHPAVLWWDINGPFTQDEVRELTASFSQDPGLITNDRLGGGIPGDYATPEQRIPATGYNGKDWETCMTINDTWGYKKDDTNFKSSATLLRNLIDIASKGGNYLLNVGPTAQGIIPAQELVRLREMGDWLKVNGDSIYGTTASPFRRLPFDGRATVKGKTLYLNVFAWPKAGLALPGLETAVKSATVLATRQKLAVGKSADGALTIGRPNQTDAVSTAIALRLSGAPVVQEADLLVAPQVDGTYKLNAADAELDGDTIQIESRGNGTDIGYWTNPKDSAHWKLNVPAEHAGQYTAKLEYACDPGSGGSAFALLVDGVTTGIGGTVATTGSWDDYHFVTLDGELKLTAGKHTIKIVATSMPHGAVMNLRSIALIPVGQ